MESARPRNFEDFADEFAKILGYSGWSDIAGTATVTITTDRSSNNECQIVIRYGEFCVVADSQNSNLTEAFSEILFGEPITSESKTWTSGASFYSNNPGSSESGEYVENTTRSETHDKTLKDAVDQLIRNRDIVFSVQGVQRTTVTPSIQIPSNQAITETTMTTHARSNYATTYGYDDSIALFVYTSSGGNLLWFRNEGGQKVYYRMYPFVMQTPTGLTREYRLEKNTVGNASLETGETKLSTSYELKNTIGKWYIALRTIALVGLLSVLVYIGIRIIISSTGQEQSKYKKMIGDWLAAICILFVLHYIMAFTMITVDNILEIFKTSNVISANGEDVFMTNIRNSINTVDNLSATFTELLIYLVLVVFTAIFTFHYLKRLVYLAFFTMIAPLIALTYPLDKVKDGQAQAFGIWIKEYIFNALMPVMHLLLYYIFVGSAMELASSNPIYALVCIGFLIPAEKFFRKMFGFDKATTSSQFGAAAGGALVMNAINKISHAGGGGGSGGKSGGAGKSGSGSSGGSGGGTSSPRTSQRPDGGSSSTDPSYNDNADNPIFGGSTGGGPLSNDEIKGSTRQAGFMSRLTNHPGQTIKGVAKGAWQGAGNVGRHYFNSANVKKGFKKAGRGIRKGVVGAAGAAALGTFGLAAGMATGDINKVFQYAGAAAAGGYLGANKVGDRITEIEKQNRDLYREGSLGSEEFKTRKTIKELQEDNDFNELCRGLGVKGSDKKRLIREFANNGISDPESIKKAVSAGANSQYVKGQGADGINTMINAAKIRKKATEQGMTRDDVKRLLHGAFPTYPGATTPMDEEEALKLIYSM